MTKPGVTPPKWMALVGASLFFLVWLALAILILCQPSHDEFDAGDELSDLQEIKALDINHQDFHDGDSLLVRISKLHPPALAPAGSSNTRAAGMAPGERSAFAER
jgi:hypothetical protein